MLNSIELQYSYLKIGIKSAMQYKVNFIGGVVALMLHSLLAAFGGIVLIHQFGGVGDWELGQIIFMFGITRIQVGVIYSVFLGIVEWAELVEEGLVDRYLVRPRGMLVQAPGARFGVGGFGPIIAGSALMIYGLTLSPPIFTWWLVPWVAVTLISGTIIQLSLTMIIGSFAFYHVRLGGAANAVERTQWQLNLFPASAYSLLLQTVITVGLPWAFMAYYPSQLIFDQSSANPFGSTVLYLAPLVALISFVIATAVWRFGARNYQGLGGV
jgi:ABC-2 type transport system permease protein